MDSRRPSTAPDPGFAERVKSSFARQQVMRTLGARLARVEPGQVDIEFDFRDDLTQQHGFVHAGVLTTVVDSACGYAAYSLMPPDASVLSVEFKVNLLRPAQGERFRAVGTVVKAGQTITVCNGEVYAIGVDNDKLVATMTATMMTVRARPGVTPG